MTAAEILKEIRPLGREGYRTILKSHGVQEPLLGVKIEYLKKIQKRVRKDYRLALDLYATGIYDAMYLAGLIADDERMTKADLRGWLAGASSAALCHYTVPWVAAESRHGWDLALEWIESRNEGTATAGWQTLRSLVSIKDDAELDLPRLRKLLGRVQKTIHDQPNQVRAAMNDFVIALGSHVRLLSDAALEAGRKIGPVMVDYGRTSCRTPYAPERIEKARKRGSLGRKRKSAKC